MNSTPHQPSAPDADARFGEDTLRLIARLPAPPGLEDRVHAALRSASNRSLQRQDFVDGARPQGRVLAWPKPISRKSDWMRAAAAAVIVFVVAGGGWGVYTHVQHGLPTKVIAMPRVFQPGGFSGAGAMRTPQTLPGPTVNLPAKPLPAAPKAAKKPATRPAPARAQSAQTVSATTHTAEPAEPAAAK